MNVSEMNYIITELDGTQNMSGYIQRDIDDVVDKTNTMFLNS